jgi:hypothetical protein
MMFMDVYGIYDIYLVWIDGVGIHRLKRTFPCILGLA